MPKLLKKLFSIFIIISCLSIFIAQAAQPVTIKLLGVNDFHGQITSERFFNNRHIGGAAVLAAYLRQAEKGMESSTVITMMGDQVGASTPASGLLRGEPSILFLNTLANEDCAASRMNEQCNMVAAVGNHEFDNGQQAMFDLINGSDNSPAQQWVDLPKFPGAVFPYISANIIYADSGKTLFTPYVVKKINGIPIAFIGAILKDAPSSMQPATIQGIKFLDPAKTINRYVPEIKAKGAHIIIVLIHEGGSQAPYEGNTQENSKADGPIINVINQLDDSIDVVMAGHTHQFLNTFLPNQHGKKILVTQANSYSSAFAEVTLLVDKDTQTVLKKSARIISTYADQWPGTVPDAQAARIVKMAEDKVAPVVNSYVGTSQIDLLRRQNAEGESNLGDLIADAFRNVMHTDMAVTNPTGIRNDIYAGTVTWGKLYSVQPFGNKVVKLTLKGSEIYTMLEQQWNHTRPIILQISGLTYTFDASKPIGSRVVSVFHDNKALSKNTTYTIATNDYLASGGSGFSVLKKGKIIETGGTDLEALIAYVKSLPQPFSVMIEGRIKQL